MADRGGWDRLLRLDPPEALRRWVPEPLRQVDPVDALRVVLVGCQAALLWCTWTLWGRHGDVPLVPLVAGLPTLPYGWLLAATLAAVVLRPRVGIPAHGAVLVVALLADQLRWQPEWISIALLLVATGPWRHARTLGWAHLASLWLWAGVAKLVSVPFSGTTATTVADHLGAPALRGVLTWAIPLGEIALGVLAARSATRERVIAAAVGLHVGAVFVLHMGLDWEILWWNLALAAAALVFLRDRVVAERPGRRRASAVDGGIHAVLVAALFVYPAGVYVGVVDPYLGHAVYSNANPQAQVCDAAGCSSWPVDVAGVAVGGTPIPPTPRTYRDWFARMCRPGQELRISGMALRAPLDRLAVTDGSVTGCRTDR